MESRPHAWLVALVLAAVLAVAPATATIPIEDPGLNPFIQEGRETAAEAAPYTGTFLDALIADLLNPQDNPTDAEDARQEVADDAPKTGTEADEPVEEAVSPEGDPQPKDFTQPLLGSAVKTASQTMDAVREQLPQDDPLEFVGEQVRPITAQAEEALGHAEAYEDETGQPASGEASIVAPSNKPLVVAGASAAAAAALVAFWLAGSSGSMGATGAAAAGASGANLRRLLPFASPLFTRFEKDTVLGHPKRESLYAAILQDPGVSLQALCDASGLSRTAATHHLRLLEMQHLIVSKRVGRSRHYYENGGRFGRDQKDAYAVLHNARSKDVARYVRDNPGTIQKNLCAGLGLQPSIAHWHLRRLQQAQLVEAVRQGRTVAYFPGTALKSLDNPMIPALPTVEAVSEATPAPLLAPLLRASPT